MHKAPYYHAHLYFEPATRASAGSIREKVRQSFAGKVRVHPLIDEAIGPHPLPMFEIDIPDSEFSAVYDYLSQHHGSHSVLIHPITGDDLADHKDHPQWIGTPLPLNLEFLQ